MRGAALWLALAAGVGFGSSFILFADASHHSGFWPVLTGRVAAVVGVGLVVAFSGASLRLPVRPRWLAVGAGVLDVVATTLLLVAVRKGLVAVVAPVAALAPAFTVLGAWWFLHERASVIQKAGLGLALVGLALIARPDRTAAARLPARAPTGPGTVASSQPSVRVRSP